ncbi:MAG: phytanoyl-CoA dioxygenase family protein [Mycobacteriaceae bacterium]|nr:phytanoyl-CoA dioxygenase family protein [Mycobacteriaceae bacterium]
MTGELRDSHELVGDWKALRGRIAEDGYVFVRGLFERELVRAVGRGGFSALQAAGWTEPGGDPVVAAPIAPVRAVRMRDAFGQPGYREIVRDPGFNRLPFTAPLASLMNQILGPDGFCYPLKVPRVVYPTTFASHQPGNYAHKDYNAVQDMFTCWVPLGDIPRSLGGLAIEPASQHSARITPHPINRLPAGWVTTDYEAGDVLIFHCLTTHAALPNQEQRMRFSAEYRWQLADQPAPRRLVTGPAGQELYSRLFGRSSWWHPIPSKVQLFDDQFGQHVFPRLRRDSYT